MEPLNPETACVVVGSGREVRLARDTAALGCPTLLLTTDEDVSSSDALTVLRLPRAGSRWPRRFWRCCRCKPLALAVAGRRGLAVEGFRYQQDDTKDDAG